MFSVSERLLGPDESAGIDESSKQQGALVLKPLSFLGTMLIFLLMFWESFIANPHPGLNQESRTLLKVKKGINQV